MCSVMCAGPAYLMEASCSVCGLKVLASRGRCCKQIHLSVTNQEPLQERSVEVQILSFKLVWFILTLL